MRKNIIKSIIITTGLIMTLGLVGCGKTAEDEMITITDCFKIVSLDDRELESFAYTLTQNERYALVLCVCRLQSPKLRQLVYG